MLLEDILFQLLDAGYSVLFESDDDVYRVTAQRGLRIVTGTGERANDAIRHAADAVLGANTLETFLP